MDKTLRSYIIYFGLLIICFLLADQAEKRNDRRYIFVIALILSFFMGYRKNTVGIDSRNYYKMFASLRSLSSADKYLDPGFYKLAYLVMKIKNDPYFVFLIVAIVTNFLMVYRLWDFRDISSYKYSIFRYITLFYAYQANCMRQFISMSIVFYGTRYLERKDYIRFLVFVGIASVCHVAALTSIAYIALEKIKWGDLDKKSKNFVNASYLLSPTALALVLYYTSSRTERYFNTASQLTGGYLSYILKIALFFIFVFLNVSNNKEEVQDNPDIKMLFIYYFIGMILTGFGFRFAQFERIGYFYYIYSGPYVGYVANEKYYRTVYRLIVLFILLRSFYLLGVENSMGQMPYLFNWE